MLQEHYRESVEQREALKQRKVLTTVRLQRAAILIAALSDEKASHRSCPSEMLSIAYCCSFIRLATTGLIVSAFQECLRYILFNYVYEERRSTQLCLL